MTFPLRLSGKTLDFLVLVGLGVFATLATVLLRLGFTSSTLLYLGVPCAYLSVRLIGARPWKRILAMSALFGGVYGFVFAYIADWNRAWAWPAESLPLGYWFGILNPIEWLWVFLWVTYIVLFYERFLERDTDTKISGRFVFAFAPAFVIVGAVAFFTLYEPRLLTWPYTYAVLAVLTLPAAFVLAAIRPHVIPKIALTCFFFIPLHFAHEVTGLWMRQWEFPGTYLALIPLPGNVFVPIEEFIIWIVLGSIVVLSYYELYVDDGR